MVDVAPPHRVQRRANIAVCNSRLTVLASRLKHNNARDLICVLEVAISVFATPRHSLVVNVNANW